MPFILLYIRLALARAGLKSIVGVIKDERAVQAMRRGDSKAFTERNVDLIRHARERRGLALVILAYICFLAWLVSSGMHWSRPLSGALLLAAPLLFILSLVGSGVSHRGPEAVSRNGPCPCGSGKRYKHCHGSAVHGAA
jgi:SEC-C motif